VKGKRRITEPLPYFLYEIGGSQCDTATPRHIDTEDGNVVPMILLFAKAVMIAASSLVAGPAPVSAADA